MLIFFVGIFFGVICFFLFLDIFGCCLGLIVVIWVFNLGVVFYIVVIVILLFLVGWFFVGFGVGFIFVMSKFGICG